jgi:hypothetical protein
VRIGRHLRAHVALARRHGSSHSGGHSGSHDKPLSPETEDGTSITHMPDTSTSAYNGKVTVHFRRSAGHNTRTWVGTDHLDGGQQHPNVDSRNHADRARPGMIICRELAFPEVSRTARPARPQTLVESSRVQSGINEAVIPARTHDDLLNFRVVFLVSRKPVSWYPAIVRVSGYPVMASRNPSPGKLASRHPVRLCSIPGFLYDGRMAVLASPRRIQRKRTAGWKMPEGAIYVGRPGKWGNPFAVREAIERDSPLWPYIASAVQGDIAGLGSVRPLNADLVVAAHFYWFVQQPHLMLTAPKELGGHDLACWCKPGEPCHADLLLEIANG